MQNVNEIFADEMAAAGLDLGVLDEISGTFIQALFPVIDRVMTRLDRDPEALRVLAAGLRSYARVAEQYAAALDAVTA